MTQRLLAGLLLSAFLVHHSALVFAFDPVRNFVVCQLSTGYSAGATSVIMVAGCAAKSPSPAGEGAFNMVWWDATLYASPADDPNVEVVRVTAISGETFTISRAQEGTSASAHNTVGHTYRAILSPTKKLVDDLNRAVSATFSGGETSKTFTGLTGLSAATYRVHCEASWNTALWTPDADKTTSQFVVHFAVPAESGDKLRCWALP